MEPNQGRDFNPRHAENPDGDEQDESVSPQRPAGAASLDRALMDEERIEPSTINPADVLCGRGKILFNHGTWREVSQLY